MSKLTLSIDDANTFVNDKGGRITILKRISGNSISFKKDIPLPYEIYDDVDGLFKNGKADQVRIQLYTDVGLRPVATIDIDNEDGIQGFAGVSTNQPMMPPINNNSWEAYELRRLNEVNAKYEAENTRLRDKVDEQKESLSLLKEEIRFKDKEHLLEKDRDELKAGNSLGGVVDKVTASPQLMGIAEALLINLLTPKSTEVSNHTAEVKQIQESDNNNNFSPQQNKLVEALEPFVIGLTDDEVNAVYTVIQYISIDKPAHLQELMQIIHEKQQENVREKQQENV